jgi:hypothetical protein
MDLVADRAQIAVAAAVHDQGFVAPSEQMATKLVANIEALGVNAQKPFHAGDQVGLWCLDCHVKVVAHEAVRVDLPLGFGACFAKGGDKAFGVDVVSENYPAFQLDS